MSRRELETTVDEIRERVRAQVTEDCPECGGNPDDDCWECKLDIEESLEITGDLCECKEEYGVVCRAHREEEEERLRAEREYEYDLWEKYGMGTSWDEWQALHKKSIEASRRKA